MWLNLNGIGGALNVRSLYDRTFDHRTWVHIVHQMLPDWEAWKAWFENNWHMVEWEGVEPLSF